MVTADTGTAIFRGKNRTYAVSFYIDDVVGNKILWNANGKAGTGSDSTLQFTAEYVLFQILKLKGLSSLQIISTMLVGDIVGHTISKGANKL